MTKYIFVTGGVISSLGKGVAAASLASLLQSHGYSVKLRKLDPYLNIDPGTMNPYQHGEVFVTKDGVEADLDIGHYERFTGIEADENDSYTAGKIYHKLLEKERKGDYLGKTVQTIPHVTDLIKEVIVKNTEGTDFVITEVGGTVGDIEGLPFYEAIRQMKRDCGRENVLYIHLTLVPYVAVAGELKSKPTQHSVTSLRSIGIQPDIILCRAEQEIPESILKKISLFCDIDLECVLPALDQDDIYNVPLALHEAGLDEQVLRLLGIDKDEKPNLANWNRVVDSIRNSKREVTIGIIGKYNELEDSYTSLKEALKHAGIDSGCKVKIKWVNARDKDGEQLQQQMNALDGVIVPGGFGTSGSEGKIAAISYARQNNIPFLGICYGMQLAAVSIARDMLGIKNANSTENTHDCTNIIGLMTEWQKEDTTGAKETRNEEQDLGGTMRLGNYKCRLRPGSKIHEIYGRDEIEERHRHRYEFNYNYRQKFIDAGVDISGTSLDNKLVEIIELPSHPWFIGVQFHPEFTSKPHEPHPLFCSFLRAALG